MFGFHPKVPTEYKEIKGKITVFRTGKPPVYKCAGILFAGVIERVMIT